MNRRDFCKTLSVLPFFSLLGCEEEYQRPAKTYALGRVSDLLYDQVYQRQYKFLVIRDQKGWATMDARCSYNGCDLTYQSDIFFCPCCRSMFTHRGRRVAGPAERSLQWYQMSYAKNQLFVDTGKTVSPRERFTTDEIEQGIVELGLQIKKETDIETIEAPKDLLGRASELPGLQISDDYRRDGSRDVTEKMGMTPGRMPNGGLR